MLFTAVSDRIVWTKRGRKSLSRTTDFRIEQLGMTDRVAIESLFDELDLPFLVLDQEFRPLFLSAAGARLLALRDRRDLLAQLTYLQPLIDFARAERSRDRAIVSEIPLQSISLTRFGGVPLHALARVHFIKYRDNEQTPGVRFMSSEGFETVAAKSEISRRERLLSLLAASAFDRDLRLSSTIDLADAVGSFDRKTSDPAELAFALTAAVNIADRFTLPAVKFMTAVDTSALLALDREALMRILLHVIFEATDFASPAGTVHIQTVIAAADDAHRDGARLELVIRAERDESYAKPLSALERYLLARVMPSNYGVSVLKANQFSAATSSTSPDNYSDNMHAALTFASSRNVAIHVRRLRREILAIHAFFPLVTERKG